MNILSDKQQRIFEKGISDEERKKREKEFYELYYKTREKDEHSFLGKLSLKTRQRLHKFIFFIFVIKNRISGFTCKVIKDEREKTERPIIFATTHVGKYDIEVSAVGIKDHFYLLSGDYENLQGIIDGKFLLVNGVIFFNEKVKADRIEVADRMIKHLNAGGNLMYFPEGAWNLKPNLPMLPCYWGIIDIAQKSNAVIIPVAVEQYGKRFKINIGKNIDMLEYGVGDAEKSKAITDLRDSMATLKWEIWETEPQLKRNKLKGKEWDNYVETRLSEWKFTLNHIEELTYKPKYIFQAKDVFAHLTRITPSHKTAFLFNKKLK